jgi:2-polyprenyl-3-methyl-5-hydroxy-6-metoxy-1,4-benzoquinol methylase
LKVLAVIANYGEQNREHLLRVLAELIRMPFDDTIVILSDLPKDLGVDVSVRVGLPGKSSWSLPFAYKSVFSERANNFDLYVYCEDDVLITERHVRAFLAATTVLPDNLIAGFTRFEYGEDGKKYFIDIFRAFHFVPGTVYAFGDQTFGALSNEHSGCFMLTRRHLTRALASPNFLKGPRHESYGMPETAATDPYTQCGLRKLVSISHFDDFVVHHLPNKYCKRPTHRLASAEIVYSQLNRLLASPTSDEELLPLRPRLKARLWDKAYYSPVDPQAMRLILPHHREVLSVGCGVGASEMDLASRGHEVTAIPLDSVVASFAAERGVRVLQPNLDAAFAQLDGRFFDAVLLLDMLQYIENPAQLLARCRSLLKEHGVVIVRFPNFLHANLARQLFTRNIGVLEVLKLTSFRRSGLNWTSRRRVKAWVRAANLGTTALVPVLAEHAQRWGPRARKLMPAPTTTRAWVLSATRMRV